MTFYLKPPRGNIHMERILDLCRLRCTYLELLNNHDQANDFCQVSRNFLFWYWQSLTTFILLRSSKFVSQNYEYLEEAVSQHTTKDRVRILTFLTWYFKCFWFEGYRREVEWLNLRITYLIGVYNCSCKLRKQKKSLFSDFTLHDEVVGMLRLWSFSSVFECRNKVVWVTVHFPEQRGKTRCSSWSWKTSQGEKFSLNLWSRWVFGKVNAIGLNRKEYLLYRLDLFQVNTPHSRF